MLIFVGCKKEEDPKPKGNLAQLIFETNYSYVINLRETDNSEAAEVHIPTNQDLSGIEVSAKPLSMIGQNIDGSTTEINDGGAPGIEASAQVNPENPNEIIIHHKGGAFTATPNAGNTYNLMIDGKPFSFKLPENTDGALSPDKYLSKVILRSNNPIGSPPFVEDASGGRFSNNWTTAREAVRTQLTEHFMLNGGLTHDQADNITGYLDDERLAGAHPGILGNILFYQIHPDFYNSFNLGEYIAGNNEMNHAITTDIRDLPGAKGAQFEVSGGNTPVIVMDVNKKLSVLGDPSGMNEVFGIDTDPANSSKEIEIAQKMYQIRRLEPFQETSLNRLAAEHPDQYKPYYQHNTQEVAGRSLANQVIYNSGTESSMRAGGTWDVSNAFDPYAGTPADGNTSTNTLLKLLTKTYDFVGSNTGSPASIALKHVVPQLISNDGGVISVDQQFVEPLPFIPIESGLLPTLEIL